MASIMIQAVVGLVALASSASAILMTAEGASSVRSAWNANIPGLLSPLDTWTYGGHGSGSGRSFINYTLPVTVTQISSLNGVAFGSPTPFNNKGTLGFGDDAFEGAAPAGVVQIPIALGAIAFFASGITFPAGSGLTAANLCTIFSGKATTWDQINSALPAIPVLVVRRVDVSGSTDVVQDYLAKVCKFSIVPANPNYPAAAPAGVTNVIAATSTSNMMQNIALNNGAIGYSVCGSVEPTVTALEVPVFNRATPSVAITCQAADYTGYTIVAPKAPLQWSDVSLTAGTKVNQFPTTYILYAYARADTTKSTDLQTQGYVAKRTLLKLSTVAFQKTLPGSFFFPLPSAALTTITCKAINALKVVVPAGRSTLPLITCPNCGETATATCTAPQGPI